MVEERWEEFQQHLDTNNWISCAETLKKQLVDTNNFGKCKESIVISIENSSNSIHGISTLVSSFLYLIDDSTTPVAYMILLALSEYEINVSNEKKSIQKIISKEIRNEITQQMKNAFLFQVNISPKIVAKCLSLFRIENIDQDMIVSYANQLLSTGAYMSILKLVEYFTWISWPYNEILVKFAYTSSWPMAEQLLKIIEEFVDISHDLSIVLVDLAIEKHDLKRAHRYIYQYSLQEHYPDIDNFFHQNELNKLCIEKKWSIGANFVGNNIILQIELIKKLIYYGEYILANKYKKKFGLKEIIDINMNSIEKYLTLDNCEIIWCYTDDCMKKLLKNETDDLNKNKISFIGIDVEWKANFNKNNIQLASIIQLSFLTKIYLIDLIELENSIICFDILYQLFQKLNFIKIGYGFKTDLKVLYQSFYDKYNCFYEIHNLIELDTAIRGVFPTYNGKSLSDAATYLLGKPLDKSQQLSNWDLRPLTESQKKYAALDARCLVQMMEILLQRDPDILRHKINLVSTLTQDPQAVLNLQRLRADRKEARTHQDVNPVEEFLNGHPLADQIFLSPVDIPCTEHDKHQYGNSLCLMVHGNPHVVVLPQHTRLDLVRFATIINTSRRKIRFATSQECIQIFGYAPGTVPPIAHTSPATCIWIDSNLSGEVPIILGGGPNRHLECTFDVLTRLAPTAKIVALTTDQVSESNVEPKFLADSMLGRVAKWLRMTGIDVLHWDIVTNPRKCDMLALATSENRIILTRDHKLAQQRAAFACYVVASDNVEAQFQEIKKHFGIEFDEAEFMSRCSKCNGKGFNIIDLAQAMKRNDVPQKVLETVQEYYECKTCLQLYWVGPKYSTAQAKMKQIFK